MEKETKSKLAEVVAVLADRDLIFVDAALASGIDEHQGKSRAPVDSEGPQVSSSASITPDAQGDGRRILHLAAAILTDIEARPFFVSTTNQPSATQPISRRLHRAERAPDRGSDLPQLHTVTIRSDDQLQVAIAEWIGISHSSAPSQLGNDNKAVTIQPLSGYDLSNVTVSVELLHLTRRNKVAPGSTHKMDALALSNDVPAILAQVGQELSAVLGINHMVTS